MRGPDIVIAVVPIRRVAFGRTAVHDGIGPCARSITVVIRVLHSNRQPLVYLAITVVIHVVAALGGSGMDVLLVFLTITVARRESLGRAAVAPLAVLDRAEPIPVRIRRVQLTRAAVR
jgi:hypothetical protein